MSDLGPESGLAVWMALRRAHQGGVATLQGHWFNSGRLVSGCVADALDELTQAGLLVLGEKDPEACGVRRATVTDTGCARYVALCQIHKPAATAAVSTPRRWACSPHDQRSHLLTKRGTDQFSDLVGVCGHRMLWSVPTSAQPAGPSCPTCDALATLRTSAAQFSNSPDSGRPPAETAPGGRPDTSPRTVAWLAGHPLARQFVSSVWDRLTELERSGHDPGALAALRWVLTPHQPTATGRCRTCRRVTGRRRPFPCIVWHQIRIDLLGVFAGDGRHRQAARQGTAAPDPRS